MKNTNKEEYKQKILAQIKQTLKQEAKESGNSEDYYTGFDTAVAIFKYEFESAIDGAFEWAERKVVGQIKEIIDRNSDEQFKTFDSDAVGSEVNHWYNNYVKALTTKEDKP